jgi:hypothetical protein
MHRAELRSLAGLRRIWKGTGGWHGCRPPISKCRCNEPTKGEPMRRLFQIFCLTLCTTSAALAQLPPEAERFPQAPPTLPGGEVVSKPLGTARPVAQATTAAVRPASAVAEELPLPKTAPVAPSNVVTTTVMPLGPVSSPYASTVVPSMNAGDCNNSCNKTHGDCKGSCGVCKPCAIMHGDLGIAKHDWSGIKNWLGYHSSSKQDGCVQSQPHAPLHTYFNCKPKWGSCGMTAGCATGSCATGTCNSGCAKGTCTPACKKDCNGQHVFVEGGSTMQPPVAVGSVPSGTIASQPTAPKSEQESLQQYRKINDGLGFTPGGTSMTVPTIPASRQK